VMSRDSLARDPFSDEAIAQSSPHTWRRLFADDHVRAKAIPLGTRTNIARSQENENCTRVIGEQQPASLQRTCEPHKPVQGSWRPATPSQEDALETLNTLSEPIHVGDFADAHECSLKTSARWLYFFVTKGVLYREGPRGHFFAKAKGE